MTVGGARKSSSRRTFFSCAANSPVNLTRQSKILTSTAIAAVLVALFLVARFLYYSARLGCVDSAIVTIRTIVADEKVFAQSHPEIGYTCDFSRLTTASSPDWEKIMIAKLAKTRQRNGYAFAISGCSQTEPSPRFVVSARPLHKNMLAFCSDQTGILKHNDEGSVENCTTKGSLY